MTFLASIFASILAHKMVPKWAILVTFLDTFFGHRSWIDFWLHFGRPLAPFGPPLGSLWLPFGSLSAHFGSLWLPFGLSLAPLCSLWATLWLQLVPFWRSLAPFATLGHSFSHFWCPVAPFFLIFLQIVRKNILNYLLFQGFRASNCLRGRVSRKRRRSGRAPSGARSAVLKWQSEAPDDDEI